MPSPVKLPPELATLRSKILAPLAEPSAVTQDPRYQELRVEVAKLDSPNTPPPEWPAIAQLGTDLLHEVEKHLQVAAYTAAALAELHGAAGIYVSVDLLSELLALPELAPKRAKGKGLALLWFLNRLTHRLSSMSVEASDAPYLRRVPKLLKTLRTAAVEQLGDRAPAFGQAIRACESLCIDLPPESDELEDPEGSGAVSGDSKPPSYAVPSPVEGAPTTQTPEEPDTLDEPARAASSPEAAPTTASPTGAAPTGPLAAHVDEAARWLAPISPESPCGAPPDSLEAFIELRTEFAKLTSVTQTPIAWPMVMETSDKLLREETKDLRLAAYLMLALHNARGASGLTLGLVTAAELLERYPKILHPTRAKSRGNFSEWLISQAAACLDRVDGPLPEAQHQALVTARKRVAAVFAEHLGDRAPSQRPLREALKKVEVAPPPEPEHVAGEPPSEERPETPSVEETTDVEPAGATPSAAPPTEPEPKPPPTTPTQTREVTVKPADAVTAVADLKELDRFLDATDDALASTARALREALPTDPRGYRFLRIALWLKLIAPPPTRPDGNTQIPSLADRDRQQLATLLANKQWAGLLQRSESLLPRNRFLLDLQRYTCIALEGLGAEYADAALAVRAEVTSLLIRFPTLPKLRDKLGKPLAEAETRHWIAKRDLATQPSSAPAEPPTDEDCSAREAEFWHKTTLSLQNEVQRRDALTAIQEHIDSGLTGIARFSRRSQAATTLAQTGSTALAEHMFFSLADEADRRGLAYWNHPLLARCLASGIKLLQGTEADREGSLKKIHRQLASLDIHALAMAHQEAAPPPPPHNNKPSENSDPLIE